MPGRGSDRTPDERRFVQTARRPSLGIEVTTGTPWVGVDQQVGHGSADALFALTEEQYVAALSDPDTLGTYPGECRRGEHDDRRLFEPAGGSWSPAHWFPARDRLLPSRVSGEILRHVDALGTALDSGAARPSGELAADTASVAAAPDGIRALSFRLTGAGAYPRPAALVAGLTAGSDRAHVRHVLGVVDRTDPITSTLEGCPVRFEFDGLGLATIAIERPSPVRVPDGPLGTLVPAVGTPEEGPAFDAARRLLGATHRRWASSSGAGRRLVEFDTGAELTVGDGRVIGARIGGAAPGTAGSTAAGDVRDDLLRRLTGPAARASRADVRRLLGAPVETTDGTDLHRFGSTALLLTYGLTEHGEAVVSITAVEHGTTLAGRFHRWRSGEFTRFLDALGRPPSDPLVAALRGERDTRLGLRGGVVSAIGVTGTGGRLSSFVDGLPDEPTRSDVPFGRASFSGERDDLWAFEQGWVRAHAPDGRAISRFTVSADRPRDAR